MRRTRVSVLILLTLTVAAPRAGERLEMNVSPTVSFEPADLTVRATVDANDDNRTLEVIAESDGYFRSSQIQLEGAQAPRTTLVSFRRLPGGVYTVRVVVRGDRGQTIVRSERSATVINLRGDR